MSEKSLSPAKKIFKKIFAPLYYSYIGCRLFNLIDRLSGYRIEKRQFFKKLRYYPNLKNPQSFNEKIVWKKLHDRNPLLPIISDKYEVRDYLIKVLGKRTAGEILIPLFYVTEKPGSINFDDLTEEYVIKPNHTSGKIVLAENMGTGKRFTIIDDAETVIISDCREARKKIVKTCSKWISAPFGYHNNEWAYQRIKRKIIIEKLLRDSNGKIPADYKISLFNGKCEGLSVWYDRFEDLKIAMYSPEWEYLDIKGHLEQEERKEKPQNFDSLLKLAELLGKPFDFIRIDLYLMDEKIYFGEMTNYSASGRIPYSSVSYDFERGSKWKLIPGYWEK